MAKVHPTAIISPQAILGEGVEVGPYCVIDEGVRIGSGCRLVSHIHICGETEIGERCEIYPFTSIGMAPQDLKYEGEASRTIIGDDNIIRENVTIHRGTKGGNMETRIGDHCMLMACSHVSHDTKLGNHVVLANAVLLAGHCRVDDYAILGGAVVCQQFLYIGQHSFITGGSGVAGNVPPYSLAFGYPASFTSVNVIGLKRRGFSGEAIREVRRFYKQLFSMEGKVEDRLAVLGKEFSGDHIDEIRLFIRSCEDNPHHLIQPRREMKGHGVTGDLD